MTAGPAPLVIDASVAMKRVLDEAASGWARVPPASGRPLIAPSLLCTECGNVLWRMARTGRIEPTLLERFWSAIEGVSLTICRTGWSLNAVALGLSSRLDHPIYDCLYLALALDRGATLATADQRFARVITRAAALPPDRLFTPPEAAA